MNATSSFRIGDWEVFPDLHRLRCGEEIVEIEPRVMAVLDELARVPGRVVTRDDLHRTVWSDVMVTDDALNRCITQLRRVLSDDARSPRFIETIAKRGYRLIAPVVRSDGDQEPDHSAIEVHVLSTTLLGHAAEVTAGEIDAESWRRLIAGLNAALAKRGEAMIFRREDVTLAASADESRHRFEVRTRTFAALTPFLTAVAAFLLMGLFLYGRGIQSGHVVATSLAAGLAGWFAGAPRRRRALDESRGAIAAFGKMIRTRSITASR